MIDAAGMLVCERFTQQVVDAIVARLAGTSGAAMDTWRSAPGTELTATRAEPCALGPGARRTGARSWPKCCCSTTLRVSPQGSPASPQTRAGDSSLPSYDAEATALLIRRVLDFLDHG